MQLQKGANAPLESNFVEIAWAAAPGKAEVDVSAYLLNASRKVEGDDGMVFYGQTAVEGVSLEINQAARRATYALDLARLNSAIETIAFCVALDTSSDPDKRLADLQTLTITAGPSSYVIPLLGMTEQALILVEVYRRNGQFKIRAVGQGFNGGLGPLATSFGVDVEGANEPVAAPAPPKAPSPTPSVSLKKVTLEKSQKVSLSKDAGRISAKLVWDGRGKGEGDLDLYCFYVLKDGTCGKVYWKDLGRDHGLPYITLSGDSQKAGEEEIVLHRPNELRYALFAAYSAVGNGAGSFASYKPKMIFQAQDGSEVTVPLLNPVQTSYWVAITHLDIDHTISIEHVETYGKSGRAFIAAEKSPRLHPDGSWDVSKGKIEFKRKA
ncbi:TerD family protein [Sphingobium aromaticiconvertens]|uniref:TerD family protein n=1 Tax=Sphingobium aromaticiconvertens TaxID=365341 RepID=UPI0030181E0D